MGKRKKKHSIRTPCNAKNERNQTGNNQLSSYICLADNWSDVLCSGYIPLSQNPEIISAVNKIANLIGGMTIHLMENTDNGDQRVKNELSRKIDITPNKYMTRNTFISGIVRTLLLEGDGNAVIYPQTKGGYLENMFLLPPSTVSFMPDGFGYKIYYNGNVYESDEFIHVVMNPSPDYPWKGTGYRKSLRSVADTLEQAALTKKGFMESKWQPSIIVKADGLTDEFSNKEGRKKLLSKYVESSEAGEPWIIPADQFEVTTVKPLSLNDLAIKDSIELDKKTVASILDIPSFILGVGKFDKDEWNNFINTRIRNICCAIEQACTKALLYKPNWYFRFNYRSIFAYDYQTLANVGMNLVVRGVLTRNELRDSIGYSPMEGLDELIILENFIPAGMIGDQKKLEKNGGGDNDE